ncbi:MAG: CehA/McbA family metallohydrolase [Kofleriaceae bacterium]
MRTVALALVASLGGACGADDAPPAGTCDEPPALVPAGDPVGHPAPLAAGPGEARAGRLTAAELPSVPSGLITWQGGDFVLANDRVALVIEDVGDSDLYDPWGGRPVGLARMAGGVMVAPNDFGELFLLTGRSSVVTESVTVVADGADGGPAILRARGRLHPLPFFDSITSALFADGWDDVEAAIDYMLAPDAEVVEVTFHYASPRPLATELPALMHAVMYTRRTPAFTPGSGFGEEVRGAPYIALVDAGATSWAYLPADGVFQSGLGVSGFLGAFTDGLTVPACDTLSRAHARLVIGSGDGVDGVVAAVGRVTGAPTRQIGGVVRRAGVPAAGVRVHAVDADGAYLTRAVTDAEGAFSLHVPVGVEVELTAYRRGDTTATATVAPGAAGADLALPAVGTVHVLATDALGAPLPVRVQLLPTGASVVPTVPATFGEPAIAGGRLHVEYATTGEATLTAPPGTWEVIVSRGYEYEVERQIVTVVADATVEVEAILDRVVATPGALCADFHIHTTRSNDAADDGRLKVASAIADGLELPVRSEHEFVADFSAEIAELGLGAWAAGLGSIELTSFEVWGHMGVFPLVPDPSRANAGAPAWQTFPTAASPSTPFATLAPPAVFDAVRARPEEPVVILNHPRGGANYFDYVGYDPVTGMVDDEDAWDTDVTLIEVFNDSGWVANRTGLVRDWLSILGAGRRVFAVGSSDSHGISSSPVGYPRTCVTVGTDDPAAATGPMVRDALAAGHATISGGIYVAARVGTAAPGDVAIGLGPATTVDVEVQAASWVDLDAIEVVVDGVTVDTIAVVPADADPLEPVVRWRGSIPITVAASGRGYVIVAAYGDAPLEPVHPGRLPFGVTEPIFLVP